MSISKRLWRHRDVLQRFFPFLAWVPELRQWSTIKADLIAGFTVAMLLIPQSMAYAHLAGLPVYMGLYAGFIPPIIAALFGSSRILSTGPVPVTSLLTAAALMPLAAAGTPEYIQYVLILAFLAGMIQFFFGLARFGVVVNFISYPVILGFINGVAIIIASMQLGNLLGVYAASAPRYYQTVMQVLSDAMVNTHWPSVGMAALTFVIILGGRRLWPALPHTLIAVVVTTFISWGSGYEKLEAIQESQIVNLPVQQMLASYQRYPQNLKNLQEEVAKTKEMMQTKIKEAGENAEETDKAINDASQAKWQLERLITRHNLETGELNRLRFRRLLTKEDQIVFYVKEQMTPIGQVDPHEWRIEALPENGRLTMQAGGAVVGDIKKGLPGFHFVSLSLDAISKLMLAALVIALIGFTEAITIATRIATQNRQRLNVNQEMIGQGLAKSIGSFFQSMPVSGGFTRTAVNAYAGAKTGFSSIVAGFVVMIVLLWLTPLFYHLPYATLAAIIMVGVLGLLDIKEMWRIWKVNPYDGIVALATLLMTLVMAPQLAFTILLGVLLSLGFYLYETMRPNFSEWTRNQEGDLVEISEKPSTDTCPYVSLLRYNGSLYFANAAYFEEQIRRLIATKPKLRYIILDCVSINKLDASGLDSLRNVTLRLSEAGIQLWFARVRTPVLEVIKRGGLFSKLGESHFYKSLTDAIEKHSEDMGSRHAKACPLVEKEDT